MEGLDTRWLPVASLILAMMLWASSFIALKLAFRSYDPMLVASLCFVWFVHRFGKLSYQRRDTKAIL